MKASFREDIASSSRKHNKKSNSEKPHYLKPGALAQIRDIRMLKRPCSVVPWTIKRCLINLKKRDRSLSKSIEPSKQENLPSTPKTPIHCLLETGDSKSRFESLPIDLMIKIICKLQHHQLKNVFNVSKTMRAATILAEKMHFNYMTPTQKNEIDEIETPPAPIGCANWGFARAKSGRGLWFTIPPSPEFGTGPDPLRDKMLTKFGGSYKTASSLSPFLNDLDSTTSDDESPSGKSGR